MADRSSTYSYYAAYPHLHPQLRAVFRQENPEEFELGNLGDTPANQLVSRLEEQLRGRREEVASSLASLRVEKAELERVREENRRIEEQIQRLESNIEILKGGVTMK